jgi:dethiobiotin synthetase
MTRPSTLALFAGTATDVGKTWWTAAVARELRSAGIVVAARKPVQSAAPGDTLDADVLADATGVDPLTVCPAHRTYRIPWAPPMAADELGLPPFTVDELVAEICWPDGVAVGCVEGVGGPRSPIAADGDNVDFARALRPDLVVVVGDAGLGTINAARLSVQAFDGFPVVVALNRFGPDPLHQRNCDFLVDVGLDVLTAPSQLAARLAAPRL